MAPRLTPDQRADRAMLEKNLQARVLYRCRKYGWKSAHAGRATIGTHAQILTPMSAGWPDLMLFRAPRVMAVELKRELGKASPEQLEWLSLMNECGVPAMIWRPSDLREGRVDKLLR
jgi:VRR-NUC domain